MSKLLELVEQRHADLDLSMTGMYELYRTKKRFTRHMNFPERTNLELVQTICGILDEKRPLNEGKYADQITFVADRPGHDARYAIDARRIRDELGWRPSVTLDEGLARTVAWYLANTDWWRALQSRSGVGERLGVNT